MKQPVRSLNEVLFDMFANETMLKPQENKNLWAIYEGIQRLDPIGLTWTTVTARKKHECIRGHEIKEGDVYCKHNVGGWGSDWKFCVGCMAMLLYFWKVDELPLSMFTHWNYEEGRPVRVKDEK
ncbi:MAG: hypothetical protein HZB19_14215 [Chloroflexi bacterium]|nr:hypothetical protein [Chloroflexota bacterium]